MDRIICDLDKTPDLSQRPPQNCHKCGNAVDGQYCQGCALLRKKFKEDLFTYYIKNGTLQDFSEPSNDNTNVVNALQEPFVVERDPGENSSQSAHYGYNCPSKVLIIPDPKPFNNQTADELPQTLPIFDPTCYSKDGSSFTYDSTSNLDHDSPNVFNPHSGPHEAYQCQRMNEDYEQNSCCDPNSFGFDLFQRPKKKSKQAAKVRYWKIPVLYDDKDYTIAITHKEPDNSLSIEDEHLDTIPATKSDEFVTSSVENLVSNPSESEGEHECDMSACENFTTFSNILFDSDYDFSFSEDQSCYDEDIPKEIYSNPLFDEEIIFMKIDLHHFNAESGLIKSLLNHDSSIISSSLKIDSLFDEFAGELTLFKSIPPGINETDCDPEEETHFYQEIVDSDSLMEEIDLSFTSDDPMPPDIEEDDYDSKRDILIREELLRNDSLLLPENESFHFDIPSSSRPLTKPPDGNSGILNVKVMGDIFEHKYSWNLKTHAKGFCPPVFNSSALFRESCIQI
nr:hypothetical protein [Tanacetum cinerariifolium]